MPSSLTPEYFGPKDVFTVGPFGYCMRRSCVRMTWRRSNLADDNDDADADVDGDN